MMSSIITSDLCMSQRILRKNNYLFSLDQKMYFSNFAGRCARAGDVGHPVGQIFELFPPGLAQAQAGVGLESSPLHKNSTGFGKRRLRLLSSSLLFWTLITVQSESMSLLTSYQELLNSK